MQLFVACFLYSNVEALFILCEWGVSCIKNVLFYNAYLMKWAEVFQMPCEFILFTNGGFVSEANPSGTHFMIHSICLHCSYVKMRCVSRGVFTITNGFVLCLVCLWDRSVQNNLWACRKQVHWSLCTFKFRRRKFLHWVQCFVFLQGPSVPGVEAEQVGQSWKVEKKVEDGKVVSCFLQWA